MARWTTDTNLSWQAFGAGVDPIHGHCNPGDDEFCTTELFRAPQITMDDASLPPIGRAFRFEVKFGDVNPQWSGQRALIDPPTTQTRIDVGQEWWVRWQAMWPADWVGRYPKWDQLSAWPSAWLGGGSMMELHHGPLDGNWSGPGMGGSAPLYSGAYDNNLFVNLIDQATSEIRQQFILTPLVRGHWYDWVLHQMGGNGTDGFIELWIDGVNVIPLYHTQTIYPNTYGYLQMGLYRNSHIGDTSILFANGSQAYPAANGSIQVMYGAGFAVGKTQASILYPTTPPNVIALPSVSMVASAAALNASVVGGGGGGSPIAINSYTARHRGNPLLWE